MIQAELLGTSFRFAAGPGLFSADRVDDGTRLLLEQLPAFAPRSVLDLGCGYGALGLPIAAKFPEASFVLVDRDTLAVEFSRRNAESHGLANVRAVASLGYRDVPERAWDWVLCNVPARIGDQAIAYILGEGARRLSPEGELRVVVIRDLGPVVERIGGERSWRVRRVADGARHIVYALGAISAEVFEHEAIYTRDRVSVGGLELERPHDINEDLGHLREALPLSLELVPKIPPKRVLIWRGGYGAAAITLASRGAGVVAADRDLLATTFTRRNAERLHASVETRESWNLRGVLREEKFGFFFGEFHASAGEAANGEDVIASTSILEKGGQAIWLGLTRQTKPWLERLSKAGRVKFAPLASRGSWSMWRVS